MPSQPPENTPLVLTDDQHARVLSALRSPQWVVACLCAAWCGTCGEFRERFAQLAQRFPDWQFVWIDVEDQAAVVGELDIDNFPTLLVQRQDSVRFFGTILPDQHLAQRLLQSLQEQSPNAQAEQADSAPRQRQWPQECNLRLMLEQA